METVTLTKDELKDIVHDSVQETLVEILADKDKREEFLELVEDFAFGKMMEEGDTGEYVDESIIMDKLNKIKNGIA
jgi:hypothetical protein